MPCAPCLFFPPFYLDLTTESLWEGSQRLPMRPKAWALLRYLVEHAPRLIPQAELLDAIWQRRPRTVATTWWWLVRPLSNAG